MSYRKASSEYGIPISTLSDKVTGRRPLLDRTITGKISVKFVWRWYYREAKTISIDIYYLLI